MHRNRRFSVPALHDWACRRDATSARDETKKTWSHSMAEQREDGDRVPALYAEGAGVHGADPADIGGDSAGAAGAATPKGTYSPVADKAKSCTPC